MVPQLTLSKDEVLFLMEAGSVYRDAHRLTEAREVFAGLRAALPKSEVPEVALGSVCFSEGKYEDAIRHYQGALVKNPSSAYAFAHLGEAYLLNKQLKEAEVALKKAIELDPKGQSGKMARALTELTQQRKTGRGEGL